MRRRLLLVALIAALVLVVVALLRPREPDVEPGSALLLDLTGSYVEAPEPSLVARLLGDRTRSFAAVNSLLAMAARDDRLDTVVLRVGGLELGWGKAQELRAAIARLREAGRKTVAFLELERYDANREYYVASAAERVVLPPGAAAPVVGLAAEYLYLGGLWEKLGVEVQVERVGRYKSAAEAFAEEEMSEAAREMAASLLDSIDAQFVAGLAAARGFDGERARSVVDAGPLVARELVSLGLADELSHLDDLLEPFEGRVVRGEDYARVSPATVGFEPEARFALVYASGPVVLGEGRTGRTGAPVAASRTLARALEDAAEDDSIAAVILRVDSPGGSPLAAELIWDAVRRVRAEGKPVVASFSDVAASGGYYLAAGADTLVAPAGSYTGSIGVFALRPAVGGLLDKLGLHVEAFTRGERADFLLSSEPLSPGARDRLRTLVVDTYELFVRRVAEGRSLEAEAVDAVGQGRVWTGAQALDRKLVDEIGGLHEAVRAGKRAVGIDEEADVGLVLFPQPRPLAQQLAEALRLGRARVLGDALAAGLPVPLPRAARTLRAWFAELPAEGPLLLPPLAVDIR